MRPAHRVHTSASAAQVWALLDDPCSWPRLDLMLRRVDGANGPVRPGDRLMAHGLVAGVRMPVDVVEADPPHRLVLLVHTAPGLRELLTLEVTTAMRGGCDLEVSVVVEGPLAPLAVVPLHLARGLTARVLAVRAGRSARRTRSAA